MYTKTKSDSGICRILDGAYIPADPGNSDYREFLKWVAAGNTPEPYTAPAAPAPQVVTMRQASRALLAAGLLDAVDAAIAQAPRESQIDWERAQDVERSNPLVASLAASLGLSDAQLDALFVSAAAL